MLWLCLWFPHLPVELRPSEDAPTVVVERLRSLRVVLAANAEARACSISRGLPLTLALIREPSLKTIERSSKDESRAMKALAAWAEQFSSDVCMDESRWLLWIELGASKRYFRGLEQVQGRIKDELSVLGYSGYLALAPTLEAGALMVASGSAKPIFTRSAIRAAITDAPITAMTLDRDAFDGLNRSGIRTVGELLEIPMAALARRFGPDLPIYLRRLLGQEEDPRRRFRAPAIYRRKYECPYPIASVEALLFPLRRILQELQGYLRGKDKAIQHLSIILRHDDSPDTPLELRLTSPQRDMPQFFAVLRETLERTTLPEPVTELIVQAKDFVEPQILQNDLFDDPRKVDAGWSSVLDKLKARLGEAAIRQLGLADDFRPERAWCTNPARPVCGDQTADRPLWVVDPRPLPFTPAVMGDPERIEAGWWEGSDVRRDYYFARGPEGARLWVYRDLHSKQWYLHGLWG